MEYRLCPNCASIIDIEYWNGDFCPICKCEDTPVNMTEIRDENGEFIGVEVE